MIRCIMETEFVVNTCVTAPIYIIDTVVSYVVIEKKYKFVFPGNDLKHQLIRESGKCGFVSI